MEKFTHKPEEIPAPMVEIEDLYRDFVPPEFVNDPMGYFEKFGKNIKSGEVQYKEDGRIKEDPTAVKDLPDWRDQNGALLPVVGKRVNVAKSQVEKSGDPFYEYRIMEIIKDLGLPGPRPVAKAEQGGIHLIVMEKIAGFRWTGRDSEAVQKLGLTEEEKANLITQAQELMDSLKGRFDDVGLVRTWKFKDMIFDVDFKAKKVRSLTPTDWERTEIDEEKLLEARRLRARIIT